MFLILFIYNMANIHELKSMTSNILNEFLFPVITKMVVEYYIDTVPLVFHQYVSCRTHAADIICYKVMDVLEWEACLEACKRNKTKIKKMRIYFKFDGEGQSKSVDDVIDGIKVSDDKKLKESLEIIYPRYIGNDIDVFDTLKCALFDEKFTDIYAHDYSMDSSTQWLSNKPCNKLIGRIKR